MGWKASIIIINKPTVIDNETLLRDLGLTDLKMIKEEVLEVVINPNNKKVYIGTYQENLLICISDLPMQLIESKESEAEKILKNTFPHSEICSIVLHSVVNLWGYSVIKNSVKIRARAGSADDGTFIELGEPLDEEKELLSKSTIDTNGTRTYLFEDFPDEPFTEDQVGENFVFAISNRYFDEQLDCNDELLFETKLSGYSYRKITLLKNANPTSNSKPWWKFW